MGKWYPWGLWTRGGGERGETKITGWEGSLRDLEIWGEDRYGESLLGPLPHGYPPQHCFLNILGENTGSPARSNHILCVSQRYSQESPQTGYEGNSPPSRCYGPPYTTGVQKYTGFKHEEPYVQGVSRSTQLDFGKREQNGRFLLEWMWLTWDTLTFRTLHFLSLTCPHIRS